MARRHDLVQQGSQFLIARLLLAVPDTHILEIVDGGIEPVSFDDALPVRPTCRFLAR